MLTMERVAAEAQVSKPVVYSRFQNRSDLLRALLESFWEEIDEKLENRVSTDDTLDEFTAALVNTYFDVLETGGPALQQILGSGAEEPDVDAARRLRFANIERLWSVKYQRALGLSAKQSDTVAAILRSALAGAGEYWMRGNGKNRAECISMCIAVMRGAFKELQRPPKRAPRGSGVLSSQ